VVPMMDAAHTLDRSWDQQRCSQSSQCREASVKDNWEGTSRDLGARHEEVWTRKASHQQQVQARKGQVDWAQVISLAWSGSILQQVRIQLS